MIDLRRRRRRRPSVAAESVRLVSAARSLLNARPLHVASSPISEVQRPRSTSTMRSKPLVAQDGEHL